MKCVGGVKPLIYSSGTTHYQLLLLLLEVWTVFLEQPTQTTLATRPST